MHIKRIKGSNLFSYDKFDIKLNNFNILIGPNASGKSNFIEILNLIKDIVKYGLENAINNRDIRFLRNINKELNNKICLQFEIGCNITIVIFSHKKEREILGFRLCDFSYILELEIIDKDFNSNWKINNESLYISLDLLDIKNLNKETFDINKIDKDKIMNIKLNVIKSENNEYIINYDNFKKIPANFIKEGSIIK
ncbi:MAG: AAA family ATPase [Promethearchaeia archaeon]